MPRSPTDDLRTLTYQDLALMRRCLVSEANSIQMHINQCPDPHDPDYQKTIKAEERAVKRHTVTANRVGMIMKQRRLERPLAGYKENQQ